MILKIVNLEDVKSKAIQYHNSGLYSCAESVFLTLIETFEVEIDKSMYGVASGFAGGGMCGSLCGAPSGALIATGLLFGENNFGVDKVANKARILSKEISEAFVKEQGNSNCKDILNGYQIGSLEQHEKCIQISGSTAKIAANIIARELGYEIL